MARTAELRTSRSVARSSPRTATTMGASSDLIRYSTRTSTGKVKPSEERTSISCSSPSPVEVYRTTWRRRATWVISKALVFR